LRRQDPGDALFVPPRFVPNNTLYVGLGEVPRLPGD
jgi:hypothetical protein